MRGRRRSSLFLLLATALILSGYLAMRAIMDRPTDIHLADMPEAEFAENPALTAPRTSTPVDYRLTPELFLELLKQYQTPENLSWQVETTVYASLDDLRTQIGRYEKRGQDYHLRVVDGLTDGLVREVALEQGVLTVTTPDGSAESTAYAVYAPLPVLGMADLSVLTRLSAEQILYAGIHTRFDLLDQRYQVVYVEFNYPDLPGLSECYWVSLEYGLPLRVQTFQGDELVYTAETLELGTF
ncbi:MAG: hypothetical protein GXX99_00030 [Clostridiales bacterium]|nr:hypothetical protein [Clostridiales bacterium]